MVGSATMTTVASMNASDEPRMVAASVSRFRASRPSVSTAGGYAEAVRRGALAGMAAAAAWAAAEPLAAKVFRAAGGLLGRPHARWAPHPGIRLARRRPRRSPRERRDLRRGLRPGGRTAAGSRASPPPRPRTSCSGRRWPSSTACIPTGGAARGRRSSRAPRVFAYEVAVHALFGVVLGVLVGPDQRSAE